jgi:hypothetical protein
MSTNSVQITSYIPQLFRAVEKEAKKKVQLIGLAARKKLLEEVLVGSRNGATYRVPKTQRTYKASLPGQAPASRLGDLRRSYALSKVSDGPNFTIKLGSPLDYALFLEEGTKQIKPRPHLKPAVKLARAEIEMIARKKWDI